MVSEEKDITVNGFDAHILEVYILVFSKSRVVFVVPTSRFLFTVLSKAFLESLGSCTDYNLLGMNTSTFGRKACLGSPQRSLLFGAMAPQTAGDELG